MPPLEEEMLESILSCVHESSLQESFFKVFVLTSVFQGVKSTLDSSLEEPIQDLGNTSWAVSCRLRFSLSNGLSCVMPMLEGLWNIKVTHSLIELNQLPHKLLIIMIILPNSFPASSHKLTVPLNCQFSGPLSHVDSHLSSLKPLSYSFPLLKELAVWTKHVTWHSVCSQYLHHFDESVVCSSKLLGLDDSFSSYMFGLNDIGHSFVILL